MFACSSVRSRRSVCLALSVVAVWMCMLVGSTPIRADESDDDNSFVQALTKGKPGLAFRYRFEYVTDDLFPKDSYASTLRTALSYRTLVWRSFDGYLQAVNVSVIGDDDYWNLGFGSLNNGKTDRPPVPDPALNDFSQAYLRYQSAAITTTFIGGRQEINLDDQRFVGAVAWRQNHQTLQSLRITNHSAEWLTVDYALLSRVYRVIGGSQAMLSNLLNARADIVESLSLTGYAYLLGFDNTPTLSTQTYGAELSGSRALGDNGRVDYEAEWAYQRDFDNNTRQIRAQYANLMVAAAARGGKLKLAWEKLGGNPTDFSFQTTLATLHKFNGWADRFLVTPLNGLQDFSAALGAGGRGVKAVLTYHSFHADDSGTRYGWEIDGVLTYKTSWKQMLALKAAYYERDTFSRNATKVWLYTTYGF